MKARHVRELATLVNCQSFLDRNKELAGSINASDSRKKLDAAIEAVAECAVDQESGKRQVTACALAARHARRKLRLQMQPVAEVAKSELHNVPELLALLMPPGGISSANLVVAANAMADAAAPRAAIFVAAGLARTFVEDIRADASAVVEIVASKEWATVTRNGGTAGILAAVQRGRKAIKVIHSLLMPALDEAPDLLAGWKTAKRVAAKPGPATGTVIRMP